LSSFIYDKKVTLNKQSTCGQRPAAGSG